MWVCVFISLNHTCNYCLNYMPICTFSGLDNKVTVYPLSMEDDPNNKRRTVGTHTSYMSCCLFPNSDQQVLYAHPMNIMFQFQLCNNCVIPHLYRFLQAVGIQPVPCGMLNLVNCFRASMAIQLTSCLLTWHHRRQAILLSLGLVHFYMKLNNLQVYNFLI